MQLISYCEPRNVMLVHGEAVKMEFLKEKIKQEFGIDCFMPANGETATIKTPITIQGRCYSLVNFSVKSVSDMQFF